jgi:mono/diheme cytochrome c family protein
MKLTTERLKMITLGMSESSKNIRRLYYWLVIFTVVCCLLVGCQSSSSTSSKALETEDEVNEGRELYELHCASCHGKSGRIN